MISVTRKTHIPSEAASRCCSRLSKWWARVAGALAGTGILLPVRVLVGAPGDDRRGLEVLRRRRRSRLPFEADHAPRVGRGVATVAHRPDEVDERNDVPDPQ